MLRLLTVEHNRTRVINSVQCSDKFERNWSEFLGRYITAVVDTLLHTRNERKQFKQRNSNERALKKAKRKDYDHSFLGLKWHNPHYLKKRKTINGQYYANLCSFKAKLKENRPQLSKQKTLFHHNNTPVHSSAIAAAKLLPLFSWLDSQWLFPFYKLKKMARWKEIVFKFWNH